MIFWSFRGNTTKTIRMSSEELQSDANMQEKLRKEIEVLKELLMKSRKENEVLKDFISGLARHQELLIKSDDLPCLLEVVIRLLEGCEDNKVLQLGMMLLHNIIIEVFKFKVRPETRVK